MEKISIYIWNVCCRAPNEDYTPGNLQTVTDNIYLNLFDQVLIDIQEVRTTSDLAIAIQLKSIGSGNSCQNHAYIHYNCLSLIPINICNIQHTCKYYMLYDDYRCIRVQCTCVHYTVYNTSYWLQMYITHYRCVHYTVWCL